VSTFWIIGSLRKDGGSEETSRSCAVKGRSEPIFSVIEFASAGCMFGICTKVSRNGVMYLE